MSQRIAVVGAGFIGRSWAMVFSKAGHQVTLYDIDPTALAEAMSLLEVNLADLESNGLIHSKDDLLGRIQPFETLEKAIEGANWVQENALENVDVKRELFNRMDKLLPEQTILASSTSAISCSDISKGMKGAGRMVVAHPANPPYLLPIVELSGAPETKIETISRAKDLLEATDMEVITLNKEIKGFVLNRLQVALLNEAFKLVEDGIVSGADLDKTIKHGLGLRWSIMGPMETIDLNAPGGIRDYLERFGPAFETIAKEQSSLRPWDSTRYKKMEDERRRVMSLNDLNKRARWRDRRLMALARHKEESDKHYGK